MARQSGQAVIEAPPSRYRVVERGRRLVVIDTHTGQPATRALPAREPGATPSTAPVADEGRSSFAVLTTSRLYDLKAPRRIVMTPSFSDRIGRAAGGWVVALFVGGTVVTLFAPMLWLVALFALLQPKLRDRVRAWITAQLDAADQAAS